MKTKVLILFATFFFGLYFNYLRYIPSLTGSVLGDDGDAFFNLWLMEDVRYFITHFDWDYLINNHIFYPENHRIFFWSDTLIFPGLMYSLIFYVFQNHLLSYYLLTFLALFLSYLIYFYFFQEIAKQALKKQSQSISEWKLFLFLLLCTYLYTFSMGRMQYSLHFQNYWSFLLFAALWGILKVFSDYPRIGVWTIALSFTFLCYSVMYYAIGIALSSLVLLFLLTTYKKDSLRELFIKIWPIVLCTIVINAPIILGFLMNPSVHDPQNNYRSKLWHLVTPHPDSLQLTLLRSLGFSPREYHHESLIFVGYSFLGLAIGIFLFYIFKSLKHFKNSPSLIRFISGLVLVNIVIWILPKSLAFKAPLVTLSFFAALTFYFYSFYDGIKRKKIDLTLSFLFLMATLFYGICLGLNGSFLNTPFNPSILGILDLLIPGIKSMRTIGRYGVIAFGLALAIVVYFVTGNIYKFRPYLFNLVLLILSLSIIEHVKKPAVNAYAVDFLFHPTEEEKNFFTGMKDPLLLYPIDPWHLNAYPQLYFVPFRNVQLVNGYTGIMSHLYKKLIDDYRIHQKISNEALSLLRENGVKNIGLTKWRYSQEEIKIFKERFKNVLFENENFLIVKTS